MFDHILIVDDDREIRELLKQYLLKNGFAVNSAKDSMDAKEKVEKYAFDLLLVDNMMPKESGIDFIKYLREKKIYTPIIILTALGEVENKIEGLSSGADDYITKPFNPQELLLRIKNIIGRTKFVNNSITLNNKFIFGDFIFDFNKNELTKNDVLINLTDIELKLLNIFLKNINNSISREEINNFLGGYLNENSINVLIARLRKKIELGDKQFIKTVRNKGYIFSV